MKKYVNYCKNPSQLLHLAVNKYKPKALWDHFARKCERTGLTAPGFILSFDCDTDLDISVVSEVHTKLNKMGIMPAYAVPGELLMRGKAVYAEIQQTGAEFLNHGFTQHTVLEDGKYRSTLFYDKLSASEIVRDIEQGHQAVQQVLGVTPTGFRTPHFGSFVKRAQLNFLYSELSRLGYQYSTSTTPIFSSKKGPWFKQHGLIEFPLTGSPDYPLTLLDSWGYRIAPDRSLTSKDFILQVNKLGQQFSLGKKVFANIYVDPSQVYDWDDFFISMKRIARYNIPSYASIVKEYYD